ncbi:MAG: hypothetical protein DME71_13085 [Verrucomicrobia bacterium]|nr:MAG: hypothetical protein DME71_13085 [Verrucomicrobiota bacterium]
MPQCFACDSFKLKKRSQFFIRAHDEPLSVVAVCIGSEDYLPVGINRCDTAPSPAGRAEFVGDYFPILQSFR